MSNNKIRAFVPFDGVDYYKENFEFNQTGTQKGITDRQKDYEGLGVVNGLVVSVNTSDLTKVDVGLGLCYDGDGRRAEVITNVAFSASSTPTGNQGLSLADYTDGKTNYVLAKYLETLSENREDEFGVIHQVYSSEGYALSVAATNLAATDNDYVLLAQVTANGVGIDLAANDVDNTVKTLMVKQKHGHTDALDSAGRYDGPKVSVGGLADNAVSTVKLQDVSVTSAKIAVGAVLDKHYGGAANEGIIYKVSTDFNGTESDIPLLDNMRRRLAQSALSFVSRGPKDHENFNTDADVTSGIEDVSSVFLDTGGANSGADSLLLTLSGSTPTVLKGVAYIQGKYVKITANALLNVAANMASGSIAPGVGFEQNVVNSVYLDTDGLFTMQDATDVNAPDNSLLLGTVSMAGTIDSGSSVVDKRRLYPYMDSLIGVRHTGLEFMDGLPGNYSSLPTILNTMENRKIQFQASGAIGHTGTATRTINYSIASWATHNVIAVPYDILNNEPVSVNSVFYRMRAVVSSSVLGVSASVSSQCYNVLSQGGVVRYYILAW